MKYLKLLLLALIIVGCSNDSDNSSTDNTDGAGGSLAIFALKGDYLYSVDHSELNVFSLIDGEHPAKVNDVNVGFNIETLFSSDEYLFVGSQNGMFIYSIANPENPVLLSSVEHFTACDPVVANATHAFVTLHSNTTCGNDLNVLQIYDTSNLSYPVLVHQRNLVNPKGVGLYGHYLIVCDDEIKIFDVANPVQPVLVKSIDKLCFDVIIRGNTMYAIGDNGLYRYQLNESNITNVVLESEVNF